MRSGAAPVSWQRAGSPQPAAGKAVGSTRRMMPTGPEASSSLRMTITGTVAWRATLSATAPLKEPPQRASPMGDHHDQAGATVRPPASTISSTGSPVSVRVRTLMWRCHSSLGRCLQLILGRGLLRGVVNNGQEFDGGASAA